MSSLFRVHPVHTRGGPLSGLPSSKTTSVSFARWRSMHRWARGFRWRSTGWRHGGGRRGLCFPVPHCRGVDRRLVLHDGIVFFAEEVDLQTCAVGPPLGAVNIPLGQAAAGHAAPDTGSSEADHLSTFRASDRLIA